jgi:hypothetical protein
MSKVQEEIKMREALLEQLNKKLEVATKSGATDTEIGKLTRSIKQVEAGDLTSSAIVKQLIKESNKKAIEQNKLKSKSETEIELERIIADYNFYMCSTGSSVWFYQSLTEDEFGNRPWVSIKKDALLANFRPIDVHIRMGSGVEDYSSFKDFNKLLVAQKRTFTNVIQSYTDQPGCLNIMNSNFCKPSQDGRTDYHWIFDAIIESISGDSKEGTKSFIPLQQTLWSKYLHPNNPFLPNLFIRDQDGRAGKGLISNTFLRRLFNGKVADNCNTDHVTGKFNSVIAGQAVIVVNETKRDKVDVERMKAFLGSPKILIEQKYQVPYLADNTGLVLSFSNEITGGITLSGTQSDNRYSLFKTSKNIYQTCQRYFREFDERDMTIEEIKTWIEGKDSNSGQNLLFNQEQVGRWINAMAIKHGDIQAVKPVHGAEYQALIDRQRGSWTTTVEQVFSEESFTFIRADLLERLIRENNRGEIVPGRNRMREEIERLIKDRGFEVEMVERARIYDSKIDQKGYQRTIWKTTNAAKSVTGKLIDTDHEYGIEENGRWIWTFKG